MNDYDNDIKRVLARIDDLVEIALKTQAPQWTDFLEPPHREQALAVLRWKTGIRFNAWGGYAQAERRRIVIYPDYYFTETLPLNLGFLEITTKDPHASPGHRDYLGAILNLGIQRAKIGDLLIGDHGAQVIVCPELKEFIQANLRTVASSPVITEEIDPEQIDIPNRREKVIRTTVASLRLDALAALGFGESRTKMVREIKAEKVKVNWKATRAPDQMLQPGDIVALRGRGRVEFREITGQSKKGRTGVVLVRLF